MYIYVQCIYVREAVVNFGVVCLESCKALQYEAIAVIQNPGG